MKIVMFSINPIYPDLVTGGASKHLFHIAKYLGTRGHKIEIYCAQPSRKQEPFLWGEQVNVFPVLPFKLPFPQPYAISGADLGKIVEKLSRVLRQADRFYIHDGELLLPDIYENIPTIISFRDNIYPESVLGSFIHKADDVICVSKYSASVIEYTAGRFFPGLSNRMHVINNGVNLEEVTRVDATSLAEEFGVTPKEDIILLHPHRPEPGKGLPETIRVAASLVHEYGLAKVKVLIPEWIDEMLSQQDSMFYFEMETLMMDLNVRENFKFIPWLPMDRMKELYSIGDVTLCLGNIVEAFGNVAYESLACGTPSVVSKVGVHRTLLPDELINKVNFGDIPSAVDRIRLILDGKYPSPGKVIAFLQSELNFDRQVSSYSDIIENCRKRDRLQFNPDGFKMTDSYILAPWCYIDGEWIFNDFLGRFEHEALLTEIIQRHDVITRSDSEHLGFSCETWDSWIEKHCIVPRVKN